LTAHRLLPCSPDASDDLPDRQRLPLLSQYFDEHPIGIRLIRHVRLVGLDLDQGLATLYLAARLHDPLQDGALLHGVGQARHEDVGGHQRSLNRDSAACTTCSSGGNAACSSGLEYGMGTSAPVTRATGASR